MINDIVNSYIPIIHYIQDLGDFTLTTWTVTKMVTIYSHVSQSAQTQKTSKSFKLVGTCTCALAELQSTASCGKPCSSAHVPQVCLVPLIMKVYNHMHVMIQL